ncbi:hypothetical protein C4D60_Mb04t03230 [Musa balbisiana]|uniref:RRM domain-containing protein n=1 Tax=Musa balbisiana TaxID=52838 RepID=A0A4S8K9A2_MUSBA|nr:hypothetical protein C4D60_Mb04t03230 [Musa balbisiana]
MRKGREEGVGLAGGDAGRPGRGGGVAAAVARSVGGCLDFSCKLSQLQDNTRVFIGGLSYGTDDQSLREAFTNYGEVVEARVIMDRETGRSRGFGFVDFTSNEDASAAISGMDGKDVILLQQESGYGGGGYGDGGSNNYGGSYNTSPAGGHDGTGGGYDNASVGGNYGVSNGGSGGSNGGVVAEGGSNAAYGRGTYGGSESTGFGSSFSNNGGYGNNNQYNFKDDDDEPNLYAHKRG